MSGRIDRALTPVALFAALALVAQSEWALALAVGWPVWVAWCAPLALDAYVLAAVRTRRDMGAAVLVSSVSVLASHAVYAAPGAWASGTVGTGHLVPPLAAGCSVVPLLVAWRIHHIDQRRRTSSSKKPTHVPVVTTTKANPSPSTPSVTGSRSALAAVPSAGSGPDPATIAQTAQSMRTDEGWPSKRALAAAAGCSPTTAFRVLAELKRQETAA